MRAPAARCPGASWPGSFAMSGGDQRRGRGRSSHQGKVPPSAAARPAPALASALQLLHGRMPDRGGGQRGSVQHMPRSQFQRFP